MPISPKIVFRLKKSCVFVENGEKNYCFGLKTRFFMRRQSHRKSPKKFARPSFEGPGYIPGLTSQTALHACLKRVNAM